jgi:hypothetical protein
MLPGHLMIIQCSRLDIIRTGQTHHDYVCVFCATSHRTEMIALQAGGTGPVERSCREGGRWSSVCLKATAS